MCNTRPTKEDEHVMSHIHILHIKRFQEGISTKNIIGPIGNTSRDCCVMDTVKPITNKVESRS